VLQANEQHEITVNGVHYELALDASRFTVTKECAAVFEGVRTELDYSLIRK
jgi:hypothetical protein